MMSKKNQFNILAALNLRRKKLRMSYTVLAKKSGVSLPTLVRVLTGRTPDPGIKTVAAIAGAMGLGVTFEEQVTVPQLLEEQARRQARRLAAVVQGTFGLEAQAVDAATVQEITDQTVHELLAGPARRLWGE
jgi:transcriptional regulator with XRE-family HTH domain